MGKKSSVVGRNVPPARVVSHSALRDEFLAKVTDEFLFNTHGLGHPFKTQASAIPPLRPPRHLGLVSHVSERQDTVPLDFSGEFIEHVPANHEHLLQGVEFLGGDEGRVYLGVSHAHLQRITADGIQGGHFKTTSTSFREGTRWEVGEEP